MPRARGRRRQVNNSVVSVADAEDTNAKMKLILENLDKNEKRRQELLHSQFQELYKAFDARIEAAINALPKEHQDMNYYEYLKMKRDEAEGKERESLNPSRTSPQRPENHKENYACAPKKKKGRKAKVTIPAPAVATQTLITPKCDLTKPLSANEVRNERMGELLFSIRGSPVVISGIGPSDDTVPTGKGGQQSV